MAAERVMSEEMSISWRARTGLGLLVLGVVLVLWAWISWAFRVSDSARAMSQDGGVENGGAAPTAGALPAAMLWGMVLVIVVLFGTLAALRAARRLREYFDRPEPGKTEYVDIWSMHKVPEYDDEDEPGR